MKNTAYKASGASLPIGGSEPPNQEPPNTARLDRAEIVQEIRELDALTFENPVLAELCFHRINELLDLLDLAD